MDAKVILRRMDGQIGMLESEAKIPRFAGGANLVLEWIIPARDYIAAAESQIAERDAQIAEMRKVLTWTAKQCSHDQYEVGNCEHTRAREAAELGLTEANACSS